MRVKSTVSVVLRAWHTDPTGVEGRHRHDWRVTAVFDAVPRIDGRDRRRHLAGLLAPWQGADLPPELWAAEDLAVELWPQLDGVIELRVDRPEGFGVEVMP
jgi:hypothetical protein